MLNDIYLMCLSGWVGGSEHFCYSVSDWGSWVHFVSEFRVGNESVFIFVQFVGHKADVLVGNEEAS